MDEKLTPREKFSNFCYVVAIVFLIFAVISLIFWILGYCTNLFSILTAAFALVSSICHFFVKSRIKLNVVEI